MPRPGVIGESPSERGPLARWAPLVRRPVIAYVEVHRPIGLDPKGDADARELVVRGLVIAHGRPVRRIVGRKMEGPQEREVAVAPRSPGRPVAEVGDDRYGELPL